MLAKKVLPLFINLGIEILFSLAPTKKAYPTLSTLSNNNISRLSLKKRPSCVDYIKNYHHYKKKINIRYTRKCNGKFEKIISDFNLGLTLFRRLFNSSINFLIKCNMKLYL